MFINNRRYSRYRSINYRASKPFSAYLHTDIEHEELKKKKKKYCHALLKRILYTCRIIYRSQKDVNVNTSTSQNQLRTLYGIFFIVTIIYCMGGMYPELVPLNYILCARKQWRRRRARCWWWGNRMNGVCVYVFFTT
jgi:hypothetical protein